MEHQRREFTAVPQIEPAKIFANVADGGKRLIMIDWEGTLWSEDPRVSFLLVPVGISLDKNGLDYLAQWIYAAASQTRDRSQIARERL